MEGFDAVLLRLAHHCKTLRGSECRLLVHLTARAIEAQYPEFEASETSIREATGISNSQLTVAKRRLHELGLVQQRPGGRGIRDKYHVVFLGGYQMPLLPLQYRRSLFGDAAPVSGVPAPVSGVAPAPVSGVPAPVSGVAPAPVSGVPAPVSGVGPAPISGVPAPVSGVANGMDYDQGENPRARRSIESAVVSSCSLSSIDRALTAHEVPNDQRPAAEHLARYLRSWAAKDGVPDLVNKPIDDQILAQCLAIGTFQQLDHAWMRIRERLHGYTVESWGFFVTALCAEIFNINPSQVKSRRAVLRSRKPVSSADSGPELSKRIISAALHGVRNLA